MYLYHLTLWGLLHILSQVPNEWEKAHMPIVLFTGDLRDLGNENLCHEQQSQEQSELWMIWSLMLGMTKRQVMSKSIHSHCA